MSIVRLDNHKNFDLRISRTETSITANDKPVNERAVLLRKITVDEKITGNLPF
jgi:hypothetical protein